MSDWEDVIAGLIWPLVLLVIAAFIVLTILFQSPLAVEARRG